MLELDAVLFEQVLFNVLDNAAKYSSPGSTIRLQSWREHKSVYLQILDQGEGIPPAESSTSLTSFTESRNRTRCAPVRGSGWRFPAASSRLCTEPSLPRTAPTDPAQCSRLRLPIPDKSELPETGA